MVNFQQGCFVLEVVRYAAATAPYANVRVRHEIMLISVIKAIIIAWYDLAFCHQYPSLSARLATVSCGAR